MLFAGHGELRHHTFQRFIDLGILTETSAGTLAATLAFLALYQDIQDELLLQIIDVVGQDREPVCILKYPLAKQTLHRYLNDHIRNCRYSRIILD
jgi:hypothetical protein